MKGKKGIYRGLIRTLCFLICMPLSFTAISQQNSPTLDPESDGQWGELKSWPLIPLHMLTLPDGKVLSFGTNEYGMQGGSFIFDVYDPKEDLHFTLPNPLPTDIFCSHVALDPTTGKVLIFGGDARKSGPGNALDGVNALTIFDPKTFSLTASSQTMEYARWYPTVVTLSNGEILVLGGRDLAQNGSHIPEVWNSSTGFRELTNAAIADFQGNLNDAVSLDEAWWYPHAFQRSNGDVVVIDAYGNDVYIMNTSGTGTLTNAGTLPFASHKMDPSIMYDVDKVLMVDIDGGLWSVNLATSTPTYTEVAQMPDGRTAANMNILADGSVIITGGTDYDQALLGQGSDPVDLTNAQYDALRYIPQTNQLLTLEAEQVARLYHSAAVQLEDGRIISGGGGAPGPLQNLNAQFFTPDIFYQNGSLATLPIIQSVDKVADNGAQITIKVNDSSVISSVGAVRSGGVTHSTNSDTRYLSLTFSKVDSTTIVANLPNANIMIPGHWMLAVVNNAGVPSSYSSIGVGVASDFFDGFGPLSAAATPLRKDQPNINGAFNVDALARFDDIDGGNWQRIFDFGNGIAANNILLGQVEDTNAMRFEIHNGGAFATLDVANAIVEGETALFSANVTDTGFMSLYKNGILIGSVQGIVPPDVDRNLELVGYSNWPDDSPLIGEVSSLVFTGNVDFPDSDYTPVPTGLAFFAKAVAHFDNLGGGAWQRVFDYGDGPATNNILLTQVISGNTLRFSFWKDGVEHILDVPGTIVQGESASFIAQITQDGLLQLFKNGELIGNQQVTTLPDDADRTNKLIASSNWVADTPLIGGVTSILIDENGSNPVPTGLAFFAEATVRFDDISAGTWQRVFDYGNNDATNNIRLTQVNNTSTLRFSFWKDGTEHKLDVLGGIEEGKQVTYRAQVDTNGIMSLHKNAELIGEFDAATTPTHEDRPNKLVGSSASTGSVSTNPLIGELISIVVDENGSIPLLNNLIFFAEATVRFDDVDVGEWQRVFDYGNGPEEDNIFLGQVIDSETMRFAFWKGDVEYSLDIPGAIVEGEVVTYTAQITSSGLMQLYKNGDLLGEYQAPTVPENVERANKLVGESNWQVDTPLDGEVSFITVLDNL
ncbi:galactose oxidase early set domain-containing protein [Marinomonas sp. THO17]|uniref:galactose oxidase early set domain-containing protein n=1 Tax=Marinomonas sp. THO17 TaxID=3149048 RepID=UPI00336BF1C4